MERILLTVPEALALADALKDDAHEVPEIRELVKHLRRERALAELAEIAQRHTESVLD